MGVPPRLSWVGILPTGGLRRASPGEPEAPAAGAATPGLFLTAE